jgi:glycosyltransferase involved in cell wall biosynthesis
MDVSIVIPTYNRLWSLPDTIASCEPGTAGIEIIVVDDGSTDGSWEWLQAQPDIIAVRQENAGKPYAANRGVAMATGRYVRFLDSDDLLPKGVNALQFAAGMSAGADMVVAGYTASYDDGDRTVGHPWSDCGDFLAQQLGERDSSHYSAYLFRRAFLRDLQHRPEFAFRDDRMFVIEAAMKDPVVAAVSEPCLIHRHHAWGRIQFQSGMQAIVTDWQEWRMYRQVVARLRARGLLTDRRGKAMSRNLWHLALRVSTHNIIEAKDILSLIHELDPSFSPPLERKRDLLYKFAGLGAGALIFQIARTTSRVFRLS